MGNHGERDRGKSSRHGGPSWSKTVDYISSSQRTSWRNSSPKGLRRQPSGERCGPEPDCDSGQRSTTST